MDFITFVWLMIFAHFIGDYVLKTEWLAETKGKEWYNMLVHCVLYSSSVGLVLMKWINGFPYYGMTVLFVSHWVIDTWKCKNLRGDYISAYDEKGALYLDQLWHFIILAGLIVWYRTGSN